MKYKDFKFVLLNENSDATRLTKLSFMNAIKTYNEKCIHVNQMIYRGSNGNYTNYSILTGNVGTRRSVETSNYYTMIFDELIEEKNKNYPLRSKSIICSTSKEYSSDFGDVYVIIPFKDVVVGVVNSMDIWDSTIKSLSIKEWNDIYDKHNISDDSIDKMAKDILDIDDHSFNEKFGGVSLSQLYNKEKDIAEQIKSQYSLDKLGFEFVKNEDINDIGNRSEVWIGDQCLCIKEDEYEQFIELAKILKDGGDLVYDASNNLDVSSYAKSYTDEGKSSSDKAASIELSKYNLKKLTWKLDDKLDLEDFLGVLRNNTTDLDDLESEVISDMENSLSDVVRLSDILTDNSIKYINDYVTFDGFQFKDVDGYTYYVIFD